MKFRTWILFVLMIVIPLLLQVFFVLLSIKLNNKSVMYIGLPFQVLIFAGFYGWWLWNVGIQLNKSVLRNLFKTFKLKISIVLFLIFSLFASIQIQQDSSINADVNYNLFFAIKMFLGSISCLYSVVIVAKIYKSSLLNRSVTLCEYIGEIVLLLYPFIGIWIINPQVNKILLKHE